MKNLIISFFAISMIFSCQKKSDDVYAEIFRSELNDSKVLLIENIGQYESAIESKIVDFPYLKSSHDSLKKFNIMIDSLILEEINVKISDNQIKYFKNALEKKSKQSFDFKSLMLNYKFDKTLRVKILELDFLRTKHKMNQSYFKKYCNVIQ